MKFNKWTLGLAASGVINLQSVAQTEEKIPDVSVKEIIQRARHLVRITKTPKGEAPLWVREEWVGIYLPCDPYIGFPDKKGEAGVLTKEQSPQGRFGVSISQEKAIMILEEHSPRAAVWWKTHGYPHKGESFGFGEDEIEVIRGVTYQKVIHVTEEMQGQPDR